MDGTMKYPGGTEKVNDSLIRVIGGSDNYHLYYLHHNGSKTAEDAYRDHYGPLLADNRLIPHTNEELMHYIIDKDIDLVFVSGWMSDTLKRCIKFISEFFTTIPMIIYNHGPNCCNVKDYVSDTLLNKNELKILNPTAHEDKDCRKAGFKPEQLQRIINCVDVDDISDSTVDENPMKRVIVVSRMVVGKGISNVVRLCKDIGMSVDVIGNKMRGQVVRDINKIYPEHCNCLGVLPREDLLKHVRSHAFISLLPNEPEGMNIAVREANMLGVPAIVWDDYGFKDFLDNEFNIFLKRDKDYISQFKKEYLPNIDFYLEIDNRKELQRRTMDRFSMDKFRDSILEAIESV